MWTVLQQARDAPSSGGAPARAAIPSLALAPSVPDTCLGVWRRTLLSDAQGLEDRATRVFWLQTAHVHIDLRVPAERPDFGAVDSLDALPRESLVELARQQGFAGVTQVESLSAPVCTWHRQIDFSPPSDARDIAVIDFESSEVLLEDGIDAVYHERWEREAASRGPAWALSLPGALNPEALRAARPAGGGITGAVPHALLARTGQRFMYARARSPAASAQLATHRNHALAGLIADPEVPLDLARAWLDFEISYGSVDADGIWTITLSTLPWREGRAPFDAATMAAVLAWQTDFSRSDQ